MYYNTYINANFNFNTNEHSYINCGNYTKCDQNTNSNTIYNLCDRYYTSTNTDSNYNSNRYKHTDTIYHPFTKCNT